MINLKAYTNVHNNGHTGTYGGTQLTTFTQTTPTPHFMKKVVVWVWCGCGVAVWVKVV